MMKKIYIVSDTEKDYYLKYFSSQGIDNRKIYTISTLLANYPYIHDDKALDYIMNHYHVCLDVARIYLKQILLYKIEKLQNDKGLFLQALKSELLSNNLLSFNSLFHEQLKKSEIICLIPEAKDLNQLLDEWVLSYKNLEERDFTPVIYELENEEMEIAFVGEQIIKLLKQGVDINSIYLCNLDDDYSSKVERIFKWQHIPFAKKKKTTLSMTPLGSLYLKVLKDEGIEASLEFLEKTSISNDSNIYNQIIDAINSTILLYNQKEFLISRLEQTKVNATIYGNVVRELSLEEISHHESDYVFLLQATADVFPKTYKDEDYFSDQEKILLHGDTTLDKNKREKEKACKAINSISHLVITYPKIKNSKECYISPILNKEVEQVIKGNCLSFLASDFFNQMYLAKELDDYVKYNTISKELSFLNLHYDVNYATYDHSFTGVALSPSDIYLSYTSLDKYLKCPFQYYVSSILKIVPYENTFSLFVGNLFHHVLEEYFNGRKNWKELYEEEISKFSANFKEKFFFDKLKDDLEFIIQTIEDQDSHSLLNKIKTEEKIILDIKGKPIIHFQGKIDKIKYLEEDSYVLAILIDYKTGNASMKKEYMPLGFHLQLPIYLYLISSIQNKVLVGGIYIQNILPSRIVDDGKSSLNAQKKKELKLQGYSNSDFKILEKIDDTFKNSNVIASLKVNQDESFSYHSKIVSEEDMRVLSSLAEEKIKEAGMNISKGDFQIQPKVIDLKDKISCEHCSFKDLCYYTEKDVIYLNSDKTFLRKEEKNGLDE